MSLAVVRCPSCRGASRVSVEAVGQMVGCPRCQTPFVAEEDIPVVQPVARPSAPRAPAASAPAVPVAPPPRRRRRESYPEETLEAETVAEAPAEPPAAPVVPDPEHDPHLPPPGGLPVSVLVGLALLPFGIPPLWWAAPVLTGQESALSLAVPIALSIAAAALCLGVVYTIDWTATTRIKGVLMLVGLSYLSAAGLFFLKKDMMDRVQRWGGDPNRWTEVPLREGNCQVRMPGPAWVEEQQPLPGLVQMAEGRRARFVSDVDEGRRYDYWIAVSKAAPGAKRPNVNPFRPDDAWFDRVRDNLARAAPGAKTSDPEPLEHRGEEGVGRQWVFEFANGNVRVVRVYRIKGRVYYLSAEGPGLSPRDAEFGDPFFGSFFVN